MKKFLLISTAILLLLIVSFLAYMKYQEYQSFKTLIRKDAETVIKIDMHAIYKSMPGDLWKQRNNKASRMFKGISIPANIFAYTLKGQLPTTVFTTFAVSNPDELQHTLKESWKLENITDAPEGIVIATNTSKTLTVAYNKSAVAIAFSVHRENVRNVLISILQGKNMVSLNNSPFKDIKTTEGHINFISGNNKGTIIFDKGRINANVTFSSGNIHIPDRVSHRLSDSADALRMWLFADPGPWLTGRNFTIDSFSICGDSILHYMPEGIEVAITRPVLQRDTIISYDYNDDFEKVETTTIKESNIPGITTYVSCNAHDLYYYLQQQQLLNNDRVNKIVFPLYQLYIDTIDNQFIFSTIPHADQGSKTEISKSFFGLHINFASLSKLEEFTVFRPYTRNFKSMDASATKKKNEELSLQCKILFNDTNKNALLQLSESLFPES